MITTEQLAALELAARSWERTPFCEGSPVKGAGVSCHHLVAEVYFDSGIIPRVPVPNGPSHWSAANARSLIADWVQHSGLMVAIADDLTMQIKAAEDRRMALPLVRQLLKLCRPGDMLGFRVVNDIHHAAIMLGGGRIVHSVMKHGVMIPPCIPFEWEYRLGAVWRPKSIA